MRALSVVRHDEAALNRDPRMGLRSWPPGAGGPGALGARGKRRWDNRHRPGWLLRARRERPRRSAAEPRDELENKRQSRRQDRNLRRYPPRNPLAGRARVVPKFTTGAADGTEQKAKWAACV